MVIGTRKVECIVNNATTVHHYTISMYDKTVQNTVNPQLISNGVAGIKRVHVKHET